ncbi:MAG: histidine kinase [Terracidiphilus sp.]|jgi:signal transduction histidine kinase
MKYETHKPASSIAEDWQFPKTFGSFFVRAFWIVLGATLLIFLMFFSQGFVKLSETGQRLVAIFVYSLCIALPSMALLTQVSIRYTARFPRGIVLIQALCLICTASLGALAAVSFLWIAGIEGHGRYWIAYFADLPFSMIITLAIGMSVSLYETLRYKLQAATLEARTRQMEQERAYKLLAEAQLSSLESRIHPHFLFNTLNSIAALIPLDPQRAEDTVGKLASLLRFSLNAQHSGLVPLEQELKIVRDYLEIESTRFGPRLRYEIIVPASLDSVKVPPLALQTLVENSVKHVAATRTEGASIRVTGAMESDRIRLEVLDDGPGFSLGAAAPEHGLGNLAARLELLFGGAGRLGVTRESEHTIVRISFPAEL